MSSITPHWSAQELKVIEVASALFTEKGVKNVTVDDIAKSIGMSKKTIYHLFSTKNELICCCVQALLEKKKQEINEVSKLNYDSIQEMLVLGQLNVQTFKVFSKDILTEMVKLYPDAWQIVEDFKAEVIYQHLLSNLEKGVQTGDYRDNLHVHVTTHIYMGLLDSAMMQHSILKTNISLDEIYKEHLLLHMYAICSDQGKAKLESHLKNLYIPLYDEAV